jgi:hypothetical protein
MNEHFDERGNVVVEVIGHNPHGNRLVAYFVNGERVTESYMIARHSYRF